VTHDTGSDDSYGHHGGTLLEQFVEIRCVRGSRSLIATRGRTTLVFSWPFPAAAHGRPKAPFKLPLVEKRGIAFRPRFSANC
jgi:hypothetical protein